LKFEQSFCVVDADLRLLWVGGDWDDFALRNGGAACVANAVLSTPLTAHIHDPATADAVVAMVRLVQELQRPLKFDYRCDSPGEIRRFRMTIQPMRDGRALMVHDLRDAEQVAVPMVAWRFAAQATVNKCSMCCAIEHGTGWHDPMRLDLPHPEEVTFTLCPGCRARVARSMQATRSGTEDPETINQGFGAGFSFS
jgi:hypothetical protein